MNAKKGLAFANAGEALLGKDSYAPQVLKAPRLHGQLRGVQRSDESGAQVVKKDQEGLMKKIGFETLDGNEAVARVAFQLSEVIALFPITPASPIGEWAAAGVKNLWGTLPAVIEMQSEEEAKRLFKQAQQNVDARWQQYQRIARNGTKENEKVAP